MTIEKVFLRTEWNYDRDAVSLATGLVTPEPSLAVQDAAEEADINTIVRRFGLTGQMPKDVRAPEYGDFTGITDYREALDAVMVADRAFAQMPADVRRRFDNDPAAFVEFCLDDANREEAAKLGLLVPPPVVPEPMPVRVVNPDTGEITPA